MRNLGNLENHENMKIMETKKTHENMISMNINGNLMEVREICVEIIAISDETNDCRPQGFNAIRFHA